MGHLRQVKMGHVIHFYAALNSESEFICRLLGQNIIVTDHGQHGLMSRKTVFHFLLFESGPLPRLIIYTES